MKKTVFFGLLAIMLVFGMVFPGCDDAKDDPTILTYKGTAYDRTYVLKIIDNSRFKLQVESDVCSGTATKSGNLWILTPTSRDPFYITVSSSGITDITGIITFDNGSVEIGPGSVTPSADDYKGAAKKDKIDDSRLIGKWEAETIIYNGTEYSLPYNGTDTYGFQFTRGNFLITFSNGDIIGELGVCTTEAPDNEIYHHGSYREYLYGRYLWTYSISGDTLRLTDETNIGWIAKKVTDFSWGESDFDQWD